MEAQQGLWPPQQEELQPLCQLVVCLREAVQMGSLDLLGAWSGF